MTDQWPVCICRLGNLQRDFFSVVSNITVISPTKKLLTHHTSQIKPAIPIFGLPHDLNYIRTHDQSSALNRLTNPCAGGCIHLNPTQTPPDLPTLQLGTEKFPHPRQHRHLTEQKKANTPNQPSIPPTFKSFSWSEQPAKAQHLLSLSQTTHLHTCTPTLVENAAALTARTDQADHPQNGATTKRHNPQPNKIK
jgi:hypothetical protein